MKKIVQVFALMFFAATGWSQMATLSQNIGHSGEIKQICVSPDGKYILSGDEDGIIILWDKKLTKQIRTFVEEGLHIQKIVYAKDGKSFFSAFKGKNITQWNLLTGEKMGVFLGSKSDIVSFSISSDGQSIISGNEKGDILIYDVSSKKLQKSFPSKIKNKHKINYSFCPSNNTVVCNAEDDSETNWEVQIINYLTEKQSYQIDEGDYTYYKTIFSVDGQYLLAAGRIKDNSLSAKHVIRVFSAIDGSLIKEIKTTMDGYGGDYIIQNLGFNSITQTIFFSTPNKIHTIDINTDKKNVFRNVKTSIVLFDSSTDLFFISDYNNLFSISATNGEISNTYYCNANHTQKCAISENRKLIAVGTYYDVLIIDLEIGKPILTLPIKLARIIDIAFTSNNQGLAILYSKTIYGDSTFFSIYDIATGNNSIAFKFDDTYSSSFSLNSANTKIAVSYGSMVKVYNLSGKELFMFNDFNEAVTTVSFADNDTKIIAACEKTTNVYDIQNMQLIKRYTPHNLGFCIQTISNEYILSAGGTKKKGAMTLWNYNTGKTISNTFKGIDQVVAECDISPDKSTIVAALGFWHGYIGYEKPMEVKVWDGKTGGIKGILQHQDKCKGVFFSANGELIYTVTYSGSIIFWETKSLKKICTIENLSNNRWVAYTPDGYFDGNQSGIATLHFVKGLDVLPLESLYEQYYSPKHILQVLSGEKIKRPSINISQINMPPIVEITNLAKNSIVTNPALQITIKATDQGGGIDEIRLYHNGKLLDGTSRGFRSVGQTHEFTVTLTDGENRIKATAFNSQRTESIPDEIVVNYKAPQQVKPNMHILAVGINTYLNPKYNLNYAKNDADAFVKSLSTGASSLFGKVEVTSINDANATKTGIVAAFDRIKATAKAEDVFVFYYAGHGVMSTGNDTEKPLFYLIPHDVTKMYEADDMLKRLGISANEIGEFSKNIKAQKQLFVIDACQSGGAMQTLASRGASEEKAIAQLARSTGTYFIAASGTEQFATEVAELGHGVFTYAVIEALKGSCKSQDGRVTVNLLKSCVEDLVPELSKKHKGQPQFPTGYGFGMDFPIVIVK